MRCLHQPLGALGKSLQVHSPLTTKYWVVPLLWLATLALPSGKSSTSPLSTIANAFSTRPLHSGNVALAFSAISLTAFELAIGHALSGGEGTTIQKVSGGTSDKGSDTKKKAPSEKPTEKATTAAPSDEPTAEP